MKEYTPNLKELKKLQKKDESLYEFITKLAYSDNFKSPYTESLIIITETQGENKEQNNLCYLTSKWLQVRTDGNLIRTLEPMFLKYKGDEIVPATREFGDISFSLHNFFKQNGLMENPLVKKLTANGSECSLIEQLNPAQVSELQDLLQTVTEKKKQKETPKGNKSEVVQRLRKMRLRGNNDLSQATLLKALKRRAEKDAANPNANFEGNIDYGSELITIGQRYIDDADAKTDSQYIGRKARISAARDIADGKKPL
jgi:hypothetical protein